MKPFFSIIIPVYNVERYLKECIYSVIDQSFTNFEVILVDDGSTDSSGIICDEFSLNNENITVIHKTNGGLSDARNIGINKSKGDYIIFLDSDDKLGEESLKQLEEIILSCDYPDVIVNRIKFFNDIDKREWECKYRFYGKQAKKSIGCEFNNIINNKDYLPGAWTIVSKRQHIIKNEIFFVKGLLHEDEQWTPRIILRANSIAYNNNCYYKYRQARVGSITQVKNIKREFDKIWIIESLYSESKKIEYNQECSNELIERAASLYWGVLIRSYDYNKNVNEYDELVKKLSLNKYIFKYSKNKKYKVVNIIINLIGVKKVSFILDIFVNIINKLGERNEK